VSLAEQAAELRKLKERRDEAKAEAKSLEAQYNEAQLALMQRMEDEDVDGIKQGGNNFVPSKTIYGQIQDRRAFIEWAREENPELIEYKERNENINELARQLLDDGEPFPPGLGFRERQYISVRAAK
jgi:hypothetical protein